MIAALDSFWWWLLAAVLGGVIGPAITELYRLWIIDPIRQKRRAKEDEFERELRAKEDESKRNREAVELVIGPLNAAFDVVDIFWNTLQKAEDRIAPGTFPVMERLIELDQAWKQVSGAITDRRLHDAFRDHSPTGLARTWRKEAPTRKTKAELEDLVVLIRNGLNDLRVALKPYLPGLMPDDLPAA